MFLDIIKYITLGIVQGLTEFLPVSSSGHLVIFQTLLKTDNNLFLSVMLHFGTLIAVVVFYFKDILGLFKKGNRINLWYLVLASIPAVIVMGVLKFGLHMDDFPSAYICYGFLATGIILLIVDVIGKKFETEKPVTWSTALIMGVAQSIAVLPGLSRSGSTIAAGIFTGTKREDVTRFSFFMSIPIIAGSALVEILSLATGGGAGFADVNIVPTLFGMAAAAVSGYFAVRFMIKLIAKCNFKWFSFYLFALSIVTFFTFFLPSLS